MNARIQALIDDSLSPDEQMLALLAAAQAKVRAQQLQLDQAITALAGEPPRVNRSSRRLRVQRAPRKQLSGPAPAVITNENKTAPVTNPAPKAELARPTPAPPPTTNLDQSSPKLVVEPPALPTSKSAERRQLVERRVASERDGHSGNGLANLMTAADLRSKIVAAVARHPNSQGADAIGTTLVEVQHELKAFGVKVDRDRLRELLNQCMDEGKLKIARLGVGGPRRYAVAPEPAPAPPAPAATTARRDHEARSRSNGESLPINPMRLLAAPDSPPKTHATTHPISEAV